MLYGHVVAHAEFNMGGTTEITGNFVPTDERFVGFLLFWEVA